MLESVLERRIGSDGRVFALAMKTKDVVTVEGSIAGGWGRLPKGKEEAAVLAGRVFDAGTRRMNKEKLRGRIADRGASLSFSVGYDRTNFDISCLPEDLHEMLRIVAQCLMEPLFDSAELNLSRNRLISTLRNSAHDTARQASIALSHFLYDPAHPYYHNSYTERLKALPRITTNDLKEFRGTLGRRELVVSIVGDIDPEKAIGAAEKAFDAMPEEKKRERIYIHNNKPQKAQKAELYIPSKANIDVYLGVSMPILYDDPLHRPMQIFTAMLGDGSTGHLMKTIRERDGLTYDIRTGLRGIHPLRTGYFYISSAFSPELYGKGLEAIQKEITIFRNRGLTNAAIEERKIETAGSYIVGMSTTSALASSLHMIGVYGQPIEKLVTLPEEIRAVTRSQIQEAAENIPFETLSVSSAGTFDTKPKAG